MESRAQSLFEDLLLAVTILLFESSDRQEDSVLERLPRLPCYVRDQQRHNLASPHALYINSGFFRRSLRSFARSLAFLRKHTTPDFDAMFKRSFSSKDRAGKTVKPTKKTYREHTKIKLQEKLDSPPVGT